MSKVQQHFYLNNSGFDSIVRMSDGTEHRLKDGDEICADGGVTFTHIKYPDFTGWIKFLTKSE